MKWNILITVRMELFQIHVFSLLFLPVKQTVSKVKNLQISINDFEVKDVIGRGHFGQVQVVREKVTNDVYAMKVLHKAETLAKENVSLLKHSAFYCFFFF